MFRKRGWIWARPALRITWRSVSELHVRCMSVCRLWVILVQKDILLGKIHRIPSRPLSASKTCVTYLRTFLKIAPSFYRVIDYSRTTKHIFFCLEKQDWDWPVKPGGRTRWHFIKRRRNSTFLLTRLGFEKQRVFLTRPYFLLILLSEVHSASVQKIMDWYRI